MDIRATLASCYVLDASWQAALDTLEGTQRRFFVITGAAGSGRSTLAEMAGCILKERGWLCQAEPMVLQASELRGAVGLDLMKSSAARARREQRLLVVDMAGLLSVFLEEEVQALMRCLKQPDLTCAMLVYDKMYAAFEPLLSFAPAAECLMLPALGGDMLPGLMQRLAEKRWLSVGQSAQAALQRLSVSRAQCTMAQAVLLLEKCRQALEERCSRQGVALGSGASRRIIDEDVLIAWEQVENQSSMASPSSQI